MKTLQKIIQFIIGALFILSGFLKAVDSQEFATLIKSYWSSGAMGYLAPVISGLEIIVGLYFLLSIRTRTTALVIALLTSLFTIAFAYAFFAKGIEDCGCMGSFISIPPFISFVRNIFIIAGSIWIYKSSTDEPLEMAGWKKWAVLLIGCFSFLLAGYTFGKQIISKNDIHKGDHLSAKTLRFLDPRIFNGKTIVFIFSPNCSHCWNATENVKSIKEIPEFSNVIGITFKDVDITDYVNAMQPNFEIINFPTSELSDVVKEVPILLVLDNGKVERIFDSHEIPCGRMLQVMLEQHK